MAANARIENALEAALAQAGGSGCPPQLTAAVLAMMTAWDLRPLLQDLPRLAPALHLVVAEGDRTVPPRTSEEAARRQPRAVLHRLPGLGHLAHEEAPAVVLELLDRVLA